MKISIIIVSWNVEEELFDCLMSIKQNKPSYPYEVIIVDNASTDGTIDIIQNNFAETKLIINNENRGFASANNIGIEKSCGQYILFLNPDTIIQTNALDKLIAFLDENKDVGACGPKLLYGDGKLQPSTRKFPDFYSALYQNTILKNTGLFRKHYRRYRMRNFNFDKQKDVDILMGAAILTRRSIIEKIGPMDESFFMYYEEADLCYRIVQAGWRIVFVPDATIIHLGGKSSDHIPLKTRMMRLKSMLIFFRKHYGRVRTGFFNCIFKPAVLLRYVFNILSGIFVYLFAIITLNNKLSQKTLSKIKYSFIFITKYSWQLFFKI